VATAANVLSPQTAPGEAAGGPLRVIDAASRRLEAAGAEVEAEIDDIAETLRDPEAACARLAEQRNRLYPEVRRLETAAMPWRGVMPGRDAATRELIFHTYRRIGRRDLPADSWIALEKRLAAALLPPGSAPRGLDQERVKVWYQRVQKA
jgi:hypothetical protein